MSKPGVIRTTLFITVLFQAMPADADSYRCGRKIVRTGDSIAHLLRICGEPRLKTRGAGEVEIDGMSRSAQVQRWHYKRGQRSLERVVIVYRGRVAAIEVGGR